MSEIEDKVRNTPGEILVIGSLYKSPELMVEYSFYIKSKYDFADDACLFFL